MAKVTAKVTEMFDGERAKEYLLINGHLKVTSNHKFYSKGEWIEIGKLNVGDSLLDENGNEVVINKIEKVGSQNSIQVYNLEVEGEHNYYADGILVHNKLSYNPPSVSGVPVTNGVITRYVGSLSEETKGAWVNHVFLGSTKIATVTSSEVRYYFQDHLGSTNVVTNSAGSQIELVEYKPFGEFSKRVQTGTSNAAWYYFTGKPLDDETGLMFYGARYYSPVMGRFITPDTIVQSPMNPQTLNRYTYCNNNPVNLVDPTGHSWISKIVRKINDFFKDTLQSLEERTNSKWSVDVQFSQQYQFQDFKSLGSATVRVGWAAITQPWQVGIGVMRWAHEPRFKILQNSSYGIYEQVTIADGDRLFVNGILNNVKDAFTNGEKVYGYKAFKVAYNPSDGPLADLTESFLQKLLFTSSFDRQLANALVGHEEITLAGHSQGAIITSNVLLNLGRRDHRNVFRNVGFYNTQITQPRAYLSAAVGGVQSVHVLYKSRYYDFSNALGPNLNPLKFGSGLVGLVNLPLGAERHALE
ncbi:MAG: hypothetical protein JNN05_00030 [Candidatus Omnitrophica bacterium]|nr:hypothetical protein [Candidatus Omnitrophota bacterium]